jgi:hypothetical protein
MKKSSILMVFASICFILAFTGGSLNAQTLNQKLITGIPNVNGPVDAYSIKYDAATGGWTYGAYDTLTQKYTIITPAGSSPQYDYALTYNSLFDIGGNSYTVVSTKITDTVYTSTILKNSTPIVTYDNIKDGWVIKDNIIYYAVRDKDKEYFVTYDTKSGAINKGTAYNEVRLAYIPQAETGEGEPIGYAGFTKTGIPYYIASSNDEVFLVIGTEEQKHYSDITWYDLKFDESDVPCYIAKSSGKFYYDRGNTFVVRGTQEFKSFDWIYGPIEFDRNGMPLYVGQDSLKEYTYRSTLMSGNSEIKTVNGGSIYNAMYTPGGKFVYVVSEEKPGKNGDNTWVSNLYVDGKASRQYTSISTVTFGKTGTPVFTASDTDNKYFVVKGDEVVSGKYDYINDVRFLPDGKLCYVATKYGNYDKNIPDKYYVFIGDDEYGPFALVNTADWKTNALVVSDEKGKYAFMAGELIDKVNYTYKYKVYTNNGEGNSFDNVSDIRYMNGKLYYFAGKLVKKDSYVYDYALYANNKKLSETYTTYTDVVVKDGKMTFVASKGNQFYIVEMKP